MIESTIYAFRETARRPIVPLFVLSAFVLYSWIVERWNAHVKQYHPIYELVSGTEFSIRTGPHTVVFSAAAKKLQECFVLPGQKNTITVSWHNPAGAPYIRLYEMQRPDGAGVTSGAIVHAGDVFTVGPFLIFEPDEKLVAAGGIATQNLECAFNTGEKRVGVIGPIKIPPKAS